MTSEASSVEDTGGVDDDPSVGHEPGVDPDVDDALVVLLLAGAIPCELVQVAGDHGEGHLGGGHPLVERHLLLLKVVRLLAGIVVPLDVF